MIDTAGWGPERWAFHLTHLLNAANPPNRHRFDVSELAKEVSRNFFPDDPIAAVMGEDLDGFDGALVPAESGKKWGILFDRNATRQRRRFTICHELGHYLLHRKKYPKGIHCDEAAVDGRNGELIEQEANTFSATLLMPLDDFKRRISAKDVPSFDDLGDCADQYDADRSDAALATLYRSARHDDCVDRRLRQLGMVQRTRLQIRKIHPHQKRATLRNSRRIRRGQRHVLR
jgi:hypothetical protein